MLALTPALESIGLRAPLGVPVQHWVFPAQTLVCGALLLFWRQRYEPLRLARVAFTLAVAVLVFALWISPQALLGFAARREGFDPTIFADRPALYALVLALRFVRLVVIVPFLEEIFWRGFALRFFISEKFREVPFGAFSRGSFAAVMLGFMLEHSRPDWPAALVTGALYNLVACRTRSLGSCVLAHAVTNALLGGYIMATRQWGFW